MTEEKITTFKVRPSPIRDNSKFYSSDKFYVGTNIVGKGYYLRNDGKVCTQMQKSAIDPHGTYFLTQQEAQDCLDRYNALHTNKEKSIPSYTQQRNNLQPATPMATEAD